MLEDREQDKHKWDIIFFGEEMTTGSRRHVIDHRAVNVVGVI